MHITLNTGRKIALVRLNQRGTYHGVLAGRPTPETDASHTDELRTEADALASSIGPSVLLVPEVLPIEKTACVGEFQSDALSKPDSEPYSSLVIAWFQKDFAPPIAEFALIQIRALDWDVLARDWNW